MARIKYSGLISGIKGKVGGGIFQGNGSNAVMRNNGSHRNQKTNSAANIKARMRVLSGTWKTLTSDQQQRFIQQAKQVPYQNSFGDTRFLSGYQYYLQVNGQATVLNHGIGTSPPLFGSVTDESGSIVVFGGYNAIDIDLFQDGAANEWIVISASIVVSKGKAYQESLMRQVAQFNITGSQNFSLVNEYTDVFPFQPPHGRIWWKLQVYSRSFGVLGQPIVLNTDF